MAVDKRGGKGGTTVVEDRKEQKGRSEGVRSTGAGQVDGSY